MPIAIPPTSSPSRPRVLMMGDPNAPEAVSALAEIAEIVTVPFIAEAERDAETVRQAVGEHGAFDVMIYTISPDSRSPPVFGKSAFSHLKGCKLVVGPGAGYDKIDVNYLTSIGAVYANSPNTVGANTADGALTLLLAAMRGVTQQDAHARAGKWRDVNCRTKNWRKATVGIVGMGNIGLQIARMSSSLGMRVVYSNRRPRPDADQSFTYLPLPDLLAQADAVVLACPLTEETRGLMNREAFGKMKHGAVVVNIARGPVIDDDAMVEALESGKVSRAALDVFAQEPHIDKRYRTNPNVTLSPHIAGAVDSATCEMNAEAIENAIAFLRTGQANTPVNLPQLREAGWTV